MILDRVVCPSIEHFGDLRPLITHAPVVQEEQPLLFIAPLGLLDLRVQMIVPALPALLAYPSGEVLCNLSPLRRSVGAHQLDDQPVLLFSPRALHQTWIEHLLPPMQALNVSPAR